MGKFDSDRFNGFVKRGLHKGIYNELRNFMLYNERDVHAVTYNYIRKFLKRKNREGLIVRNEPMLKGKTKGRSKPDLVVFKRDQPIYVLELKVFPKNERINDCNVWKDVIKLDKLVRRHEMSYGFLIVVYDSERSFYFKDGSLRKEGLERISVIEINMRVDVKTNRQRRNYNEWRNRFDTIWSAQRKKAA